MLGLVNALARQTNITYKRDSLSAPQALADLREWSPDLIVAAGHQTHRRALVLKWRLRLPLCVLMKPSLPRWLFDFCIVPKHDGWRDSDRVLTTYGAINNVQPQPKNSNSGLVLLGGESRHADWQSDEIVRQVITIVHEDSERHWTIADSRRSPPDLLEHFSSLNVSVMPWASCPSGWLADALGRTERVWVTPDSVSMVYEALSGGCQVGLLDLPMRNTRVAKGMQALVETQRVMTFDSRHQPWPAPRPLAEADRAAQWLLERLS